VGLASKLLSRQRHEGGALVMGILNVTPDSFYDGGVHASAEASCARADQLLEQGADILDIGGESTRPGAPTIPADTQIERISPALRHAVARGACVSVDTRDPAVARFALSQGAELLNDVSCLADSRLARVVAEHEATLILMHSRQPMSEMRGYSKYPENGYQNLVEEVRQEWIQARKRAIDQGVAPGNVWFDPGLGFNKSAVHSLTLLARLSEFTDLEAPIVLGASRKSFISSLDNTPPQRRLGGSIAACITALNQGANVMRVHDVEETRQALRLTLVTQRRAEEAVRA
jgi:dihydropteroate synthase